MSLTERVPATTAFGEVTPWNPTKVAGAEALLAREQRIEDTTHNTLEQPNADAASETQEQDSPLITATSRVGRLLQRLSDRIEKGADRADRTANFVADTKERGAEYAKDKIRSIGRAAVATTELTVGATLLTASATARGVKKLGEVSGDAFMTGMNKVETAMDKTGEAINNRVDTAKNSYQTYQFNRETKTNDRKFRKEYAKEVKAFDKDARREQKSQAKQDKIDLKQAAREDAKFERSMRKKAAQERKAARRAKWIERLNTVKSASAEKIESAKDTLNSGIDSSREFAERSKRRVQVTRAAGRMALNTYRDTKEAFKAN